jgi:hypothetical protein
MDSQLPEEYANMISVHYMLGDTSSTVLLATLAKYEAFDGTSSVTRKPFEVRFDGVDSEGSALVSITGFGDGGGDCGGSTLITTTTTPTGGIAANPFAEFAPVLAANKRSCGSTEKRTELKTCTAGRGAGDVECRCTESSDRNAEEDTRIDDPCPEDDRKTCSDLKWEAQNNDICYASTLDPTLPKKQANAACKKTKKMKSTQQSAVEYCEAVGARLCTETEVQDSASKDGTCAGDRKWKVWTSTECGPKGKGMFVRTRSGNKKSWCAKGKSKAVLRCCADVQLSNVDLYIFGGQNTPERFEDDDDTFNRTGSGSGVDNSNSAESDNKLGGGSVAAIVIILLCFIVVGVVGARRHSDRQGEHKLSAPGPPLNNMRNESLFSKKSGVAGITITEGDGNDSDTNYYESSSESGSNPPSRRMSNFAEASSNVRKGSFSPPRGSLTFVASTTAPLDRKDTARIKPLPAYRPSIDLSQSFMPAGRRDSHV